MRFELYLTSQTAINSVGQDLHTRAEIMKLLGKKHRPESLRHLKQRGTTEKKDNLNLIKIKNLCASKDTIRKLKRQPIE